MIFKRDCKIKHLKGIEFLLLTHSKGSENLSLWQKLISFSSQIRDNFIYFYSLAKSLKRQSKICSLNIQILNFHN